MTFWEALWARIKDFLGTLTPDTNGPDADSPGGDSPGRDLPGEVVYIRGRYTEPVRHGDPVVLWLEHESGARYQSDASDIVYEDMQGAGVVAKGHPTARGHEAVIYPEPGYYEVHAVDRASGVHPAGIIHLNVRHR